MVEVKLVECRVEGSFDNINAPEHLYLTLEISGTIKELIEVLKFVSENAQDRVFSFEGLIYILPYDKYFLKVTVYAKVLASLVKSGLNSEKAEVRELAQKVYNAVAKIFPAVFKLEKDRSL